MKCSSRISRRARLARLADIPQRYLAQMALYRAALAPLWPDKRLRMLLVWTAEPLVVDARRRAP